MPTDFESFKKLTPEERIKELGKLIDVLNKEIEERQKDIKAAEQLIMLANDESKVLEKTAEDERPKPTSLEEKTKKPKEQKNELERLLDTAPIKKQVAIEQLARQPLEALYGETRNIYQRQKETGIQTLDDTKKMYAIAQAIRMKDESGYKPPDAGAEHMRTATERMLQGSVYKGEIERSYKST